MAHDDVARIGNLLLVTEKLNDRLADKTFTEKSKILRPVSGVEPEILAATNWGATKIMDRSKRMAKRAYKDVWKI